MSVLRLGGWSMPFSAPAVWYPTLGVLALEEIVEVPIVAAVVLGRLLASGRPRTTAARRGPEAED